MQKIEARAFIDGVFRQAVVEIDGPVIRDVQPGGGATSDRILLPGLIDLHVHGGANADFMDGSEEAARAVAAHHARHGTTALAATTLSSPNTELKHALRGIVAATMRPAERTAEIAGVHLEGPYLNPRFAGAQNRDAIRPASVRELEQYVSICGNLPMIVTIAPEIEGALEIIAALHDRVTFSIGHSAATFSEATAAIEAGARHFTHLFNAMSPLHHREPGVVGAALLAPEATVELIADGHHVHRAVLRVFAQLLHSRTALVTDAMRACGMPDGTYKLFEHEVRVSDGAARLEDGTLAGSVLTMFGAVRNMVELAGLPLEEAVPLATTVPAQRLGLATRKGKIAAGYDADLVLISPDFQLQQVWTRGIEVL